MPSVETIYQEIVLPLPPGDRIRLAKVIMEHANQETLHANGRLSALELLENLDRERVFPDADSVDEHLKAERESWDS